jgi:hypothetical protein
MDFKVVNSDEKPMKFLKPHGFLYKLTTLSEITNLNALFLRQISLIFIKK